LIVSPANELSSNILKTKVLCFVPYQPHLPKINTLVVHVYSHSYYSDDSG